MNEDWLVNDAFWVGYFSCVRHMKLIARAMEINHIDIVKKAKEIIEEAAQKKTRP